MAEWDTVVIGAGVLGTFHALFAADAGRRTLLIERGDLPREASVRNFGLIIPSAQAPGVWRERGLASAAIYRDLARRVSFPIERDGLLYVASTPAEAAVLDEFAALGPALGYDCALLDPERSRALNPALDPRTCRATLHAPADFALDPRGLFRRLIPWMVERLGCAYQPRTVATAVSRTGDRCRVRTAAGDEHDARHVIVCAGSDFRTLVPDLFAASGLTVCKLQMMRTVAQPAALPTAVASGWSLRRYPAFAVCPSHERLLNEPLDPRVERFGIHVLLVQDAAGGIIVGDSHEYGTLDCPPDDRLSGDIEAAILDESRRLVRLPTWEIAGRWSSVYAVAAGDGVFRATIDDRIHVVTGIGGRGMTCGPALARETIARLD